MEEKFIAEVETKITYDIYKKFYRFSLFKGRFYKIAPRLFYIIISIAALVVLLTGLTFGFEQSDIYFFLFIGIFVIIMQLLIHYIPKKAYSSAKALHTGPNRHRFTEDTLFVETAGELTKGTSEIKYEALYKVYELDDFLYIFISSPQAFVIEKKNFEPESLERVRGILKAKLGKKYKDLRKKR